MEEPVMTTTRMVIAVAAILGCSLVAAQEPSEREIAKAQEVTRERQETLMMAEATISRLRQESPESGELIDKAYGYAVFDATKGGLLISGAGGKGVAQLRGGREPVFMRMRSVGIGLTAGAESYKLVLLFEDEANYEVFLDGERDFKGSAQGAAGGAAGGATTSFQDGVALYHLSDKGLLGNIDMSTVKFSTDDDLNEKI
jgi:lipid-binding SYLF domain-containing protein